MDDSNEKSSYVTYDGRTVVNVKALLRKPKVQRTLERLAANNALYKWHPSSNVAIVRRKPDA